MMLRQLNVGLGDVPESRRVPSGLSFTVQGSATTNGCDRRWAVRRVQPPPIVAGNVGESMVLGLLISFPPFPPSCLPRTSVGVMPDLSGFHRTVLSGFSLGGHLVG